MRGRASGRRRKQEPCRVKGSRESHVPTAMTSATGEEPSADMLGSSTVGSWHDAESMASRAQLSIKKMEKKARWARCRVDWGNDARSLARACDHVACLLTRHIAARPWAPAGDGQGEEGDRSGHDEGRPRGRVAPRQGSGRRRVCVVSVQVRGDWRRDLQDNWISGLSLSLVNLPLSISLGVAAATTPTRGVLGTVWCAPTLVSAALYTYACLPACLRARDS